MGIISSSWIGRLEVQEVWTLIHATAEVTPNSVIGCDRNSQMLPTGKSPSQSHQ